MAALPIDLDRAARTPLATQIPYGGAWHTWNQGVKSWEVMKKIAAPVPEMALHIVGEAWSTNQGWVEGALETAEAVVGTMARIPAKH
jgi:monoamine oxidase